jgi:hypothetical protein
MKLDELVPEMPTRDLSPRALDSWRECRILYMSMPEPLIGLSLQIEPWELNFKKIMDVPNEISLRDNLRNFTEMYYSFNAC